MDISKLLREYRKRNQLTQEDVANQLNISRQAISAWENNLSCPDLDNLLRLHNLYGFSLDYLAENASFAESTVFASESSSTTDANKVISLLTKAEEILCMVKIELCKNNKSVID